MRCTNFFQVTLLGFFTFVTFFDGLSQYVTFICVINPGHLEESDSIWYMDVYAWIFYGSYLGVFGFLDA